MGALSIIAREVMAASRRTTFAARAASAVTELSWLLDLLVTSARYAEPALDELDQSLLPGVARLRAPIRSRFASLWDDDLHGCPELLVTAHDAGCLDDDDLAALLIALTTSPARPLPRHALLNAPAAERRAIRRRLLLLHRDVTLRRRYRDLVAEVWHAAEPRWNRFGRAVAAKAAAAWSRRLRRFDAAGDIEAAMPPRHPLSRADSAFDDLLGRRRRFRIVPVYFCMSGGQVTDLDSFVHLTVPASAREPIRRTRDALFVADRARILAEPTRVRVLMHLLAKPSGVMSMTRALGLAQPTISEHVRVLVRAGLVSRGQAGYSASWRRAERVVEDIRASLARWS
jgi:ArsR family transcriptional regulator